MLHRAYDVHIMAVRYEWDPVKSLANLRKHGVGFADAVIALEDEQALKVPDTGHHEYRFRTLGVGPESNVLFVVHAEQGGNLIRVISARRATKTEILDYFEGI